MPARFKCMHCIHCCFFAEEWECPVVFPWERRLLAGLLAERGFDAVFEPVEVYGCEGGGCCVVLLYRWVLRGFCPFYDHWNRRCSIHPYKPLACRMFPLLLELPSGRLLLSAACPAVARPVGSVKAYFPEELRAAETVFLVYMGLVEKLRGLGLRRVDASRCSGGCVDADIYLESAAGSGGVGVEGR